jgi:hypothetical protein
LSSRFSPVPHNRSVLHTKNAKTTTKPEIQERSKKSDNLRVNRKKNAVHHRHIHHNTPQKESSPNNNTFLQTPKIKFESRKSVDQI